MSCPLAVYLNEIGPRSESIDVLYSMEGWLEHRKVPVRVPGLSAPICASLLMEMTKDSSTVSFFGPRQPLPDPPMSDFRFA
jgi:hypothetical protein